MLFLLLSACQRAPERAVHAVIVSELDELVEAASALERACPETAWDPTQVEAMREAWRRANRAFETVEGPLQPLFPDLSLSIDARYEEQLRTKPDPNPFDADGVRGLHAIERVLWSDRVSPRVAELERSLPGATPARFPASAEEARDFKVKLVHRLVTDAELLRAQWADQRPDLPFALDAIYWSIKEQRVELTKSATHDEESAYARASLDALRANLAGARAIYAKLRPAVLARGGGAEADRDLTSALDDLERAYSGLENQPDPPPTWSSEHPSAADRETPFGKLDAAITRAFDSRSPTSVVSALARVSEALGTSYRPPT